MSSAWLQNSQAPSRPEFLFKNHWRLFCAAFASVCAANVFALSFPLGIKFLIDTALSGKNVHVLYPASFFLFLCFILKAFFDVLKSNLSVSLAEAVALDLKSFLFQKILNRPLLELESRPSSEYLSYFTRDVDVIKRFLGYLFLDFLYSLVSVFFIWLILLKLAPDLALLCFVFMLPPVLIYAKWGLVLRNDYEQLKNLENTSWKRIPEILKGIRTIRVFNQETNEFLSFHQKQEKLFRASVNIYSKDGLAWSSANLLASSFLVVLLVISLQRVFHGKMTIGMLAAVNTCFVMLFLPLVKMALLNGHWQDARVSFKLIFDFLQDAPFLSAHPPRTTLGRAQNAKAFIELKNVCFGYNKQSTVLKGVSFSLQAGQKAAIVGMSGSGKTTIVLLLARLLKPNSGMITMNGRPISEISAHEYSKTAAFALQDDFLFQDTIRDNILCGRQGYGDVQLLELAKETGLFNFISELPEGLDTSITENFTNISFGQRQKIVLARALLGQPEFLILDEPTSFLDAVNEEILLSLLRGRLKSTTVVMVSHRLTSVRDMDKIIVLENGQVAGEGDHEKLITENSTYQVLCLHPTEGV